MHGSRRIRTRVALRLGRFLGISDLSSALRDLQHRVAEQAAELDQLRSASATLADESTVLVDTLVARVADLEQQRSVEVTMTYLAHARLEEDTLISVVLATRNRAHLVGGAVASVLTQSYENWELVVVDDGSDDGSAAVLAGLTDPRIHTVDASGRSVAAARNAGLDRARGEYVVYLDDDNLMHPHWLRGVAWAFDLRPDADVVVGAYIVDDERRHRGLGRGGSPQLVFPSFDRQRVAIENAVDAIQLAHRRALPEARFDEQFSLPDWDFVARLTRDRDPFVIPALAGIYGTSAPSRLSQSAGSADVLVRVREKIVSDGAAAVDASPRESTGRTPRREPLVSVVIPFRDAEPFLDEAIRSVVDQTYKPWELILVDDGSTDGGPAIARQFAEEMPEQVRVLTHPDGRSHGEGATRNLGISAARGRYLAFVDADDVWLPNKLELQLGLLDAHPDVAMVWGPTLWWPPQVHGDGVRAMRELGVETDRVWEPPELGVRMIKGAATTPAVISAVVRSDVLRAVGGYDESLPIFADQVFFVRLCLREAAYVHGVALERYRQHPDSVCARFEREGIYDPEGGASAMHARYLQRLEAHLVADGTHDPRVLDALRVAQDPYREGASSATGSS